MARNDKIRDAGKSIVRHKNGGKTKSRWLGLRYSNDGLNGPVIIRKSAKPTKVIYEVDPRRYPDKKLRLLVLKRDNFKCRYCHIDLTEEITNIDHVKPWKFGGLTELKNLVAACKRCNKEKGNKTSYKP